MNNYSLKFERSGYLYLLLPLGKTLMHLSARFSLDNFLFGFGDAEFVFAVDDLIIGLFGIIRCHWLLNRTTE